MKTIAIISLILLAYSLVLIVLEFVATLKTDKSIGEHHLEVHLSILLMLFITCVSFILWLFFHKGFSHGFYQHIINESMWGFIFIQSYTISMLTRHFRKERTGDDFVLCVKNELGLTKKEK